MCMLQYILQYYVICYIYTFRIKKYIDYNRQIIKVTINLLHKIFFNRPIKYLANFAGAEDRNQVAAGVIGFDTSMTGRRMANECIQEIRNNFRGDLWNHNGPGVITRILKKICSTKNVSIRKFTYYNKMNIRYKF